MKKKTLLLALALLTNFALIGCGENAKPHLSLGSKDEDNYLLQIDYSSLFARMDKEGEFYNETFLLTVVPTNGCSCWEQHFKPTLTNYCRTNDRMCYVIGADEFGTSLDKWDISVSLSSPTFVIVNKGKILFQNPYSENSMFNQPEALANVVNKYVEAPHNIYINYKDIDKYTTESKDKHIVSYIRKTCGDCSYCLPKVIFPYGENKDLKVKNYVVDIDPLRGTDDYQPFKDDNFLSELNNKDYGYITGVVPTFQAWENGKLVDASVYFNDEFTKNDEGKWQISTTFYTDARAKKLHYVDDLERKSLEGLVVDDAEITEWAGTGYWDKAAASKYHTPLLEAFLDFYTK